LLAFLDIRLPERWIGQQLPKKKNMQKHSIDPFSSWKNKEKSEVVLLTSELAEKYGFSFQNK